MCIGECECLCVHVPVQIWYTYICGFYGLNVGVHQIHMQEPHLPEQWCLEVETMAGK